MRNPQLRSAFLEKFVVKLDEMQYVALISWLDFKTSRLYFCP